MSTIKINVYEALLLRLKRVFDKFDYVYIAFSGGKDSGVLLSACIDYIRKYYPDKKLGVFHLDYEIQYAKTLSYIDRIFEANKDILEIFRVCVPIKVSTCTSMFQHHWRPWDTKLEHLWVREQPEDCYKKEDFDFYSEEMWDYDLNMKIAAWLQEKKKAKKICCLLGIRTQESYNRWRLIYTQNGSYMNGKASWIQRASSGIYNAYPIYDWQTSDVWTANGKFGWDYNRVYDLYYKAGVPIERQRVASPFILPAQQSLKLYRILDPDMWGKMLCRVNGVNFTGIYGGTHAVGWRKLKRPSNMTWKEYMYFLLETLPQEIKKGYIEKLKVSIEFWRNKGGCLDVETIKGLITHKIPIEIGGCTSYKTNKISVRMEYQDDIDLPAFRNLPTYKRVCICILKNDHYCTYMGFTPPKANKRQCIQIEKALGKYNR